MMIIIKIHNLEKNNLDDDYQNNTSNLFIFRGYWELLNILFKSER